MTNLLTLHKELGIKFFKIPIEQGHNPESYFWIMPVRCEPKNNVIDGVNDVIGRTDLEISIEEENIRETIYPFLEKYFDKNLIWNKMREDVKIFEWYLTDNFYTYATMNVMLKDIEKAAHLLETDYDNPYLDMLKHGTYNFNLGDEITDIRLAEVLEFYKRFIPIMRNMMAKAPENNLISFMGP